jgi:predicted unusual protein kinase regulating ubiquinone biosynthesis (AarF/ABC1/UbiB family)
MLFHNRTRLAVTLACVLLVFLDDCRTTPTHAFVVTSTTTTTTRKTLGGSSFQRASSSLSEDQEMVVAAPGMQSPSIQSQTTVLDNNNHLLLLEQEIQLEAELAVAELVDEECALDPETGEPDIICTDETTRGGFRARLKRTIGRTLELVRGGDEEDYATSSDDDDATEPFAASSSATTTSAGELLERGWEKRAKSSSLVRNAEVWKFALSSVFRALRPRTMRRRGGATDAELVQAQIEAATYIRDGLLQLGPSFVKLGQVASTRTDVLPNTYTDILKTLTDEVPGFGSQRAKDIIARELGRPVTEIFTDFSEQPLKAASLGQVHTAWYKGQKVAIKVQRAGLKELFDIDLKNLRKLAVLLEKFDPKSDGADRDWISIYDESERLLYLEIDYLHEADNAERFARDFADIEWVRVPRVYREVSTPRVLVMEFVESFKLTDVARIDALGLDRRVVSKRIADAFLRQIIETAYFHADPHSGNLCINTDGNLVYYDFGQMDELKPNVRQGLRTFCTALFSGGPMISDLQLAKNAKDLVRGVEQAGVLSKGADRLAVEKLARYFMRTFKDKQLGKASGNIKETLGADLQTLTENNSFRFPSTFTFVFRAFVSVEGIGKELDPEFDIGKLAQPFIEKFTDVQKGYGSGAEKSLAIFRKATGLNSEDIETAVMQPRKIAYIEETLRAMETGSLKIRVRSLENEKALERMGLRQGVMENMLLASVLFNAVSLTGRTVFQRIGAGSAVFFLVQAIMASAKIKKFDKTQAKYVNDDFGAD